MLKPLLLALLLLGCGPPPHQWRTPLDRQGEAVGIVLGTFEAPEIRQRLRLIWRKDARPSDRYFDCGYDAGFVHFFLKFGDTHVGILPGDRISDTYFADALAHLTAQWRHWGPDPQPVVGWYRDYGHAREWIWNPSWGLVAKANRRLKEAGL